MEILTNLQRKILLRFSELPDKEAFYLTGGTALSAFFLKHRRSNDLDFFTNIEELILPLSQKLEASLIKEGFRVERLRGFHSFVELSASLGDDSTVVHFTLDSPFRFEPPSDFDEIPGVKVDSLIDIATNKLLALFGRAELRDFIDVYFLVKEYYTKEDLTGRSAQKDPGFDLYWLGVAMERINQLSDDSPDMLLLTRSCSMEELKDFFRLWRKDILKEITGRS
ncbi:MAG: nucleotidyl transferase AbiEii/AbiGii toxin family protein [Thermodesulfobacteriota bacterium]|nr:nucleotidyl transferase AbiEii/AbiGii toxin family protein [Thermodesulfobacteriota bacterium]